jgi:L-serine dehydratase
MAELLNHARQNNLSSPRSPWPTRSPSRQDRGRRERLLDDASARCGRSCGGPRRRRASLPGPIQLKTKAGDVSAAPGRAQDAQRGVGLIAAYALAGSEENARGHLVVTAPTGGSAGRDAGVVYSLGEKAPAFPDDKIRDGLLAGAGGRLSRQAQCDPCREPRRLPGRDRRRLGDGGRDDRTGLRLRAAGRGATLRIRRSSTISA